MGNTTGYAIPSERNPNGLPSELVFPWDQAAYVVIKSEELGFHETVRERVDFIQKMLGNPSAVSPVLAAWQDAVFHLTKAVDGSDDGRGLETANENLGARWNGASREAAVAYVGRIITATKANRDAISKMSVSINNVGAFVSNAYSQAIVHISSFAAALAQYEAGWTEAVLSVVIPGNTTNGRSEALKSAADFMAQTGEIIKSVENYMTNIGGEVDNIITEIGKVEVPAAISDAALDIGGWQPRNPTGPAWGQPS